MRSPPVARRDSSSTPRVGLGSIITPIKSIQAAADEVRAASPDPAVDGTRAWNDYWRPRETSAWYLNTMSKYAAAAERSVAEGRPWEATDFALEIGELLTELRMKKLWESSALWGQKRLQELDDAAQDRRKGEQADRVALVDAMFAAGKSKRQAFRDVGMRQGVKAGTIEKDYYQAKKTSQS